MTNARQVGLLAEFLFLYIGLPIAVDYNLRTSHVPVIPILVLASVFCLGMLLRDRTFDRKRLWNVAGLRRDAGRIVAVCAVSGAVLTLGVWLWDSQRFMFLPRSHPLLWVLIMVLYPVLSVYPQEIIYRAYFFHRYAPIFPTPALQLWIGALAFGFVHIVFGNIVAVLLTIAGGWLFATTYRRTGSLAAVSLEHALYGCLVFTVGLGTYFYHGTRLIAERLTHGG